MSGLGTTVGLFEAISSYICLMAMTGSLQPGELFGMDKEHSIDPSKLLQGIVWVVWGGWGIWDTIVKKKVGFFSLFS